MKKKGKIITIEFELTKPYDADIFLDELMNAVDKETGNEVLDLCCSAMTKEVK